MGLCVLYYVEYSLYNVKKVGYFLSGLELHFNACNPLPNNKILDKSNLKAFADDKLKMIQLAKFVLDKKENDVGKEENAGNQLFLLFPKCFPKAPS